MIKMKRSEFRPIELVPETNVYEFVEPTEERWNRFVSTFEQNGIAVEVEAE